jgi:hypothetical protein
MANFKIAITEMYPRIPWKLVTDLLGSAEHTFGTAGVGYKINLLLHGIDQFIVVPHLSLSEYISSSNSSCELSSFLHAIRPFIPPCIIQLDETFM